MKKLLFCAAMMLLLGLQALPVNAAAAAQPFVRWSVYSAAAGNENALRAAVAAQNSANVKTAAAQALKLAQVHKTLAADAFNLQSKTAGTADKARMALLVINPAQLDAYKKVLAKEMQSAVTNEEGVLALLATTETARPNVFHLLELYSDDNAYRAHIDGPYFQEYNKAVQTMVTDKVLIVNKPQAVTLSGKNLK